MSPWMWSRCRWVSRMFTVAMDPVRSRPSVRMPVPASRITCSPLVERELHARRVAPVAVHLRPRGRDRSARAPDLDPHESSPLSSSRGQKKIIAPEDPSSEATIGNALDSIERLLPLADLIVNTACAGRPSRTARVVGSSSSSTGFPFASNGPYVDVHSSGAHPPHVLERAAQQRARGLVVEDQVRVLVDEEGGSRDAGQQVSGEDQLQGFLSRHYPILPSLTQSARESGRQREKREGPAGLP